MNEKTSSEKDSEYAKCHDKTKSRFTVRKGVLLAVLSPVLFVLSGLFLMNTVLYPSNSLPYMIGQFLCLIVSPTMLVLGITICIVARKRQPKTTTLKSKMETWQLQNVKKTKPPMPRWEHLARVIYALSLFAGTIVIVVKYPIVGMFPLFWGVNYVVPSVMGTYLLSSKRGRFAAIFFLLISLLAFFGIILPSGLISVPGIGVLNYYYDWTAGIDPLGDVWVILAVRSGIVLSASIFLVVARLLQHKRIHCLTKSRVFKTSMVIMILTPLLLMFAITPGEPVADPTVAHPNAYSWFSLLYLQGDSDLTKTSRTFDPATGLWTYTLAMCNSGSNSGSILQIWAGREVVAPFETRVTVNGTGITVSNGEIIFAPGASGTVTFTTTQGHNTVTLALTGGARWSYSWQA
jgi:hypothetical protein